MANYYDELLKLCGFEAEEINNERPRIEKAFRKLELGPEDVKRAESRVKQNHDIELMGVRKLLGVWFKELVDLVLARDEGEKVVYYGFPTIMGPGMAVAIASQEIYCACPDVVLCHTMGQIFNKLAPILEAGEENGLPPGHGLCSLQQIRVGALAKGIIPIPDMVFGSSYFCDMGSKADELLHERYGHPTIYIDGSMDSRWGEYPEYLPQRVEFLGAQLSKLFDKVKEILGVEVTQDVWNKANAMSRDVYSGIGQLTTQVAKADPMPISRADVEVSVFLFSGSTGRARTEGPNALAILNQEVKKRIDTGVGVVEEGAPRIMTMYEHFSDPSITHMMEDAGLAISATVFGPPPKSRPTYTTLSEMVAEREMRLGAYHSAYGIAKRCELSVEDSKVDGVIYNYLYNCRPFALTSHLVKRWIEENMGVPVLSLEFDLYDSRSYSAAALRTRVETFAEMLRAKKSVRQSTKG